MNQNWKGRLACGGVGAGAVATCRGEKQRTHRQAGERSNKPPCDFDMELNSAQSVFFLLSIYSGQSVLYLMTSSLVGNRRILLENIILFQFCLAEQTLVCFVVCCASSRTQTSCFSFLNCFVSSIQLFFITLFHPAPHSYSQVPT